MGEGALLITQADLSEYQGALKGRAAERLRPKRDALATSLLITDY